MIRRVGGTRAVTALTMVAVLTGLARASLAQPIPTAHPTDGWHDAVLRQLCRAYGGESSGSVDPASPQGCLELIAAEIGQRLVAGGLGGVPPQDVAALALLMSRESPLSERPGAAPPDERTPDVASSGVELASAEPLSDLSKGQEGFRQGVDRLSDLPLSERMVVTGDVTSGFQMASVSDVPDLTAAFGRARVNFVTRAVSASSDGLWDEGYFFVQMIAAGGAFDASQVGGPEAFSPLNDVATDRSLFNQGVSRGNLYLKKAFYEQGVDFGRYGTVAGRVGVISLSDFFDTSQFANNESRQFINGALVNSPAYKGGLAAPGFMAEYRRDTELFMVDAISVRTGYAMTRSFRALTSPLWTNEIEAATTLWGRRGTYRLGGTVGNVPDAGGLHGLHMGFDQWLTDGVGIFARYAQSSTGPGSLILSPVHRSYSAGAQWRVQANGLEVSAWGLGFSQAFPIAVEDPLVSERILEGYYRRQLSESLSITPDFQLVFGAGGSAAQGTHAVGSLRMTVGF